MKMLIAGDFYISDGFRGKNLFEPSILSLFTNADFRIVNLEAPITAANRQHKILKTGPHLRSGRETTLPALSELRVDLVTMANNHIKDYGGSGILDTIANLRGANIDTVGAGLSLPAAARSFALKRSDLRVRIINFAENEWAQASSDQPGANPLNLVDNTREIISARQDSEFVIVIIHGGNEYSHFPSPRMVKLYRYYAENGASAIVGHHPHCISGYEVHKGVPIFYSLGNFMFTMPSKFESSYSGLILDLQMTMGKGISWSLIPIRQFKCNHVLTLLDADEKASVMAEIENYSKIIADDVLLNQSWQAFLADWGKCYLDIFSPIHFIRNDFLKSVLNRLGIGRLFMRRKHYAQILNYLRCESHAEVAEAAIEKFLK